MPVPPSPLIAPSVLARHRYAHAVHDGVRVNEGTDADVATFGACLRNEVEEGFVGVQHQLKHTVQELLRVYLRGKLPLKSDHQVQRHIPSYRPWRATPTPSVCHGAMWHVPPPLTPRGGVPRPPH